MKAMLFHLKHKWLPWEVLSTGGHVTMKRSCEKCNYTVKRVKVEQTR